jgi:hypothetical protein
VTVQTEFVAECVRPDQGPVPIRFTYDPAAPLEVVATFPDQPDVDWRFSRDLLGEALDGRAGLGDVQAWTSGKALTLRLRGFGDDGAPMSAVFAMPARKVAQFLARTAHLVPYGQERVDIDRELVALLGDTA